MGNQTIELEVGLGLDVAQSQLNKLHEALEASVQVKSSSFNQINSSIDKALDKVIKLRGELNTAFKTSTSSKRFFNEYEKLFNSLSSIGSRFSSLGLDDLIFSPETTSRIQEIKAEMESLTSDIQRIKSGKIGQLFEDNSIESIRQVREIASQLGIDLSKASFQQFSQRIDNEMSKVQQKITETEQKIRSLDTTINGTELSKESIIAALQNKNVALDTTGKVLANKGSADKLRAELVELYKSFNLDSLNSNLGLSIKANSSIQNLFTKQEQAIVSSTDALQQVVEQKKASLSQAINDLLTLGKNNRDPSGNVLNEEGKIAFIEKLKEQFNTINFSERQKGQGVRAYIEQIIEDLRKGAASIDVNSISQEIFTKLNEAFSKAETKDIITDPKAFGDKVNIALAELFGNNFQLDSKTISGLKGSTVENAFETIATLARNSLKELKPEDLTTQLDVLKDRLEVLRQVSTTVKTTQGKDADQLKQNITSYEELANVLARIVAAKLGMVKGNIGNIFQDGADGANKARGALENYIGSLTKLETRQKALSNVSMAVTRWMGFYQVLNLTRRAIRNMINHITELDTVMTKIAVVTNMSQDDLWNQIGQYSEMARKYGVAIKGVYEVSQLYYQQGLQKGDVMTLTQETLKMARIAGIDYSDAADYMTTAIRGFKLEMSDAAHVTDVFSNLAAHTASSTEELAVAISKTAASAASVNSSFEATSAMMATMISTTRESATNIGTALKSIIARYGEMKTNLTGTDEEGEEYSLNKVDKALQSVGITLHDTNGQFRDFDDVILELAEAWDGIDKNTQRYIATVMAGNRQQSRFLALVSNVEEYKRALSLAENADDAGTIQTAKTLDSIDAKVERMKVTIQEFYTSSGIQDLYKGILDTITNVISAANNLPKAFGNLPVTAIAVGAQLISAIKNLAQFAIASLQHGIEQIRTSGQNAFKGMIADSGVAGKTAGQAFKTNFEAQMSSMANSKKGFLSKLVATDAGKLVGMASSTLLSAGGAALSLYAMNKYGASRTQNEDRIAQGSMFGAAALQGLSGFISGTVMSGSPLVGALSGITSLLPSLISAISMNTNTLTRELELSAKNLQEAQQKQSEAKGKEKDLLSAYDKLKELEAASYKSKENLAEYTEYMNSLADTYPELVSSISDAGDAIIEVSALERALAAARLETADATLNALKREQENKELLKKNLETLTSFSGSMYTPDNLYKLLYGSNQFLNIGNPQENALKVVKDYNAWARVNGRMPFQLNYDLTGQGLKDPGQAYNILTDSTNQGVFEDYYDSLLENLQNENPNITLDKLMKQWSQNYQVAASSYINLLKNFSDAAAAGEGPTLSYSTLVGREIDDLNEIREFDADELFNAIETTRKIASDYIKSYNLSIENLDNLIHNTQLTKQLQLEINSTQASTKKDYNKYKSFMASMIERRYGTDIAWDDAKNIDIIQKNYKYWTDWLSTHEKQADYLMNDFDAKNFLNEQEVRQALKEQGGLDETAEEQRQIVKTYVDEQATALNDARERVRTAIQEFAKNNENIDEMDTKKAFKVYGTETTPFIAPLLDNITSELDTINSLRNNGYTIAADNYLTGLEQVYQFIGENNLSSTQQAKLLPLLKDLDFSDSTALDTAIDTLTGMEGMSGLVEVLRNARNRIVTNVLVQAQMYADKAKDVAKDLDNLFGDIGKSKSYASLIEDVQKLLTNTKNKSLKFEDLITYDQNLGSYVLSQQGIQESIVQSEAAWTDSIETLRQNADKRQTFFENLDLSDLKDVEKLKKVQLTDAEKTQLGIKPGDTEMEAAWTAEKQAALQSAANAENAEEWRQNQIDNITIIKDREIALIESIQKNSALNAIASLDFASIVSGTNLSTEKQKFITFLTAYNSDLAAQAETLWELLLTAQYDQFELQSGISLSKATKQAGAKARAETLITALDELTNDAVTEYSDSTVKLAKEHNVSERSLSNVNSLRRKSLITALETELETSLQNGKITIADYNEVMATRSERAIKRADVGKVKTVQDMIKDGLTTSELKNYVTDWGHAGQRITDYIKNGELTNEALKSIYEKDEINGGFRLIMDDNFNVDNVITKLGEAYNFTLEKGTAEYQALAEQIIQEWIDRKADENMGQKAAAELRSLASASIGEEISINYLPEEIKTALGLTGDTYTIVSEAARDALIAKIDNALIDSTDDPVVQATLRALKEESISKVPSQQSGFMGLLQTSVTEDDMKNYLKSKGISTENKNLRSYFLGRGYKWDNYTKSWKATAATLVWANNELEQAIANGAAPEEIRDLQRQITLLDYELEDNAPHEALQNLIEGYQDLTPQIIADFKAAFGIDLDTDEFRTIDSTGKKEAKLEAVKAKLGEEWAAYFDEYLNQLADSYIENISKAGSLITDGTTSKTEIAAFQKAYSKVMDGETVEFYYDSILKAWTFDPSLLKRFITAQADTFNFGNEQEKYNWIKSQIDSFTKDALDFSSYLDGTITIQDTNKLKHSLKTYLQTLPGVANLPDIIQDWFVNRILSTLSAGGQTAIDMIKAIKGDTITQSDIEAAYRAQIEPLVSISDILSELEVGSIVATNQIDSLNTAGFTVNADGVVNVVGNLVDAYNSIYEQMQQTGEATVSELNSTYAKLLTAQEQNDIDAVAFMGDAMGMTYDTLGTMLNTYGIKLEDWLRNNADLYESIGAGQIRFTNFTEVANRMGWEPGSEVYTSAFKEYNDALIELNEKAKNKITDEIKQLGEVHGGDQINLTDIWTQIQNNFNELLKDYTGNITNLGHRVKVPGTVMAQYFPEDNYLPSDYSTINGFTFTARQYGVDKNLGMGFASINKLGEPMTYDDLNAYVESLITKAQYMGRIDADMLKWLDSREKNLGLDFTDFDEAFSEDQIKELEDKKLESLHKYEEDMTSYQEALMNLQSYGAEFKDGILTFSEHADIPAIMDELTFIVDNFGDGSKESLAAFFDALNEFLASMNDLIGKGIEGSLSNLEKLQLEEFGETYGLQLDFSKTPDGLKLSQKSAIALYQTMKSIDGLQARITFDKLKESMIENNENYSDISANLARIKELSNEINRADGEVSGARLAEYEAELAVAQEILEVRSTSEDSSFDFMNNDIPAAQNNPLKYAESWGKAWQTLTDSVDPQKNGGHYGMIQYQDFYNMVTEMGHIAEVSGTTIQLGAENFIANAEDAAALIEKGAKALTAVDSGEMLVNLPGIGIDFANAASGMSAGINDGIHALAESQVQMLDGLIQLLETIVAMEKIGDIDVDDVMGFSIGDLFEGITMDDIDTAEFNGFTAKFTEVTGDILKLAETNEDLAKGLDNIKVNGKTMRSLFKAAQGTIEEQKVAFGELGISMEAYFGVMDAFVEAAKNGDYNLDNIAESTWEILDATMPDGMTIDMGSRTVIFSGHTHFEVNWDSAVAQSVLNKIQKDTNKDLEQAKQEIIDSVTKVNAGEAATTLELAEVLTLEHKMYINDNGQYEVKFNNHTYTYGDKNFNQVVSLLALQESSGYDVSGIEITGQNIEIDSIAYGNVHYKAIIKPDGTVEYQYDTDNGTKTETTPKAITDTIRKDTEQQIEEKLKAAGKDGKVTQRQIDWELGLAAEITPKLNTSDGHQTIASQTRSDLNAIMKGTYSDIDTLVSQAIENYNYDGTSSITLDGQTFDINFDPNSGKSMQSQIQEQISTLLGLDGTLITEISTAISQAMSGEGGKAIGSAISEGLEAQLTNDIGELEVKVPEVKVSAEKITIDLSKVTPSTDGELPEIDSKTTAQAGNKVSTAYDNIGESASEASTKVDNLNSNLLTLSNGVTVDVGGIQDLADILEQAASAGERLASIKWETIGQGITAFNAAMQQPVTQPSIPTGTEQSTPTQLESLLMLTADNSDALDKIQEVEDALTKVNESQTIPKVDADTSDATSKLSTIAGKLEEVGGMKPTPTVTVSVTGDDLSSPRADLEYFVSHPTTSVSVHTKYTSEGTPPQTDGEASGNVGGGGSGATTAMNKAMGTIGLAHAKSTLMGELGPELVVSNNRYFVAGQSGPEFVDLDDDAIVFNHLQTQQLLKNGMSPTRGQAVTNERNAVAFAKGSLAGGPAMASASAALAALKQLRAQWQALAQMSVQDLAGAGGGGGGGGGGKDKDPQFIRDLELWYNWLQKIARLEKQINYEEALRSKYASDYVRAGKENYTSQLNNLNMLKDEADTHKNLYESQQTYFNKRRDQLNTTGTFSALYSFDEYGQLKYKDGKLEQLSKMVGRNELGKPNYTPKEQYDMIVAMGYGDQMLYDTSGNEIDRSEEGWEVNAIQAFWDKMDAEREEMQSLYDSVQEHKTAVVENYTAINELIQEIEDNQISLENQVLDAIVEMRERVIEESEKERDAIQDAGDAMVEGLTEQLEKEREMYQRQQDTNELGKLQRQLSILQRSGGSGAQIASLRNQISDKTQQLYFDAQQQQIDELQEAIDTEIDRLNEQIDLMKEELEYEKDHGLLWREANEILKQTPEKITSFIMENTSKYWGESATEYAKNQREILYEADQFVSFRDSMEGGLAQLVAQFCTPEIVPEEFTTEQNNETVVEQTGAQNDEGNNRRGLSQEERERMAREAAMQGGPSQDYINKARKAGEAAAAAVHTGISNIGSALGHGYSFTVDGKTYTGSGYKDASEAANAAQARATSVQTGARISSTQMNQDMKTLSVYDRGGIIDEDKLALVHAKEAVLTPEQAKMFRDDLLGHSQKSIVNQLKSVTDFWQRLDSEAQSATSSAFSRMYDNDSNGLNYKSDGYSVWIENASVNMQVARIADDYDAHRAGEQALEKMLQIARKTSGWNRIGG